MRLLGRDTLTLPKPPPLSDEFHYSLGDVDVLELGALVTRAFEFKEFQAWEPSPSLFGLATITHRESDCLVAATSLLRPCFLHQFVVEPAHQRKGLGQYLLWRTADLFNLRYLLAQVDYTTRDSGVEFWAKNGFREVGS